MFDAGAKPASTYDGITIGTVVDTNDPQEMGRVRIVCPKWGDSWSSKVEDLPWALYASPFAGQTQLETRGPGIQTSTGGISYGLWAIPKVGTQVLVCCIDGNPMTRAYLSCLYDQFANNTLPHGRFTYEDHPAITKTSDTPPYGPLTATEKPIEPLTGNMNKAFGTSDRREFATRGADFSVAGVRIENLESAPGKVADDDGAVYDGWTNTQGYQLNRGDPGSDDARKFESQVTSLTTPGFHALSMDDRQENCRIRVRTTSGHQIIMDDTNERIYISTAEGNNWIEMDQSGNIDMFTTGNFSVRAENDINISAGGSVRIDAVKDVSVRAGTTMGLKAGTNMDVTVGNHLNLNTSRTSMQTNLFNVKSESTIILESGSVDVLADMGIQLTCGILSQTADINITSVDIVKGATVRAQSAHEVPKNPIYVPSRLPQHEPWARTMTKSDTSTDPELPYDSPDVGRVERGRKIDRGTYWRR